MAMRVSPGFGQLQSKSGSTPPSPDPWVLFFLMSITLVGQFEKLSLHTYCCLGQVLGRPAMGAVAVPALKELGSSRNPKGGAEGLGYPLPLQGPGQPSAPGLSLCTACH